MSTPYVRYGNHPSGQDDFDGQITDDMTYEEYCGGLYYNTGLIIEVPTNGIPPIGINRTPRARADQPFFSDEDLELMGRLMVERAEKDAAQRERRNARRRAAYAARKAAAAQQHQHNQEEP